MGPGLSCYAGVTGRCGRTEPKRTCPSGEVRNDLPPKSATPARSPILNLREKHKPRRGSGPPGRTPSEKGRDEVTKNEEGSAIRSSGGGGGLGTAQAQSGKGGLAGAHLPPVDEEASRHGHGDLFQAVGVGAGHFAASPDDDVVIGLMLEQAPRRLLAPEAQARAAVFVDRTEMVA